MLVTYTFNINKYNLFIFYKILVLSIKLQT